MAKENGSDYIKYATINNFTIVLRYLLMSSVKVLCYGTSWSPVSNQGPATVDVL